MVPERAKKGMQCNCYIKNKKKCFFFTKSLIDLKEPTHKQQNKTKKYKLLQETKFSSLFSSLIIS